MYPLPAVRPLTPLLPLLSPVISDDDDDEYAAMDEDPLEANDVPSSDPDSPLPPPTVHVAVHD